MKKKYRMSVVSFYGPLFEAVRGGAFASFDPGGGFGYHIS